MASDHLQIRIEHLSATRLGLTEQGLLLYSPSTVQTLKEELSHSHLAPPQEIMVYYDGTLLSEKERIVDKRVYQVRLPPVTAPTTSRMTGHMLGAIPKTVTFDEDVHVDGVVEVDQGPIVLDPIYIVFSWRHRIHLLDMASSAILSPSPKHRLGRCVLYADWGCLRELTCEVPNTDPTTWLYDRLRRDYGVYATSSLFGIHTAPLAELHRYQEVVYAWLDKKANEGQEEEEEEEETEEEDLDDIFDDVDEYMDDSEMWR